ncbi:MAG: OmpA family protein [Deltaproteobacteria bacterium]|jgi:chemotaxis protein MotB
MDRKRRLAGVVVAAFILGGVGGCVSKTDYLTKVEESEKLRSDYAMLEAEKDALDEGRRALRVKVLSLEEELARLRQDKTNLEEISQAESGRMKKEIADLRQKVAAQEKQNSLLTEENQSLRSKALDLEVQKKEEVLTMRRTYDDLLEDMKSEINKGKITITQLEGKLKVNLVDEILFDSGKTTIKPQGVKVLERVGKILLKAEDQAIRIEGHTDNVPIGPELATTYPTNWELSAARATTVARYLQEKVGIDPTLLSAAGYGPYQSIASNETEEGRAKNRRIEILLVPREITPASRN